MAHGFKTGGRTAGTLNKRTQDMLDEVNSTGETPLQYMLRVMRDSEASPARRDTMAIAAAPYVHSKLAQVDATAQEKQNITAVRFLTEEEWPARRDAQRGNSHVITNDVGHCRGFLGSRRDPTTLDMSQLRTHPAQSSELILSANQSDVLMVCGASAQIRRQP